ncbi:MAG: amidohydrolase family protein [Candidatus Binatus sp.]|uniref:amidohydrolase family protein n=1 Tax=Candidatus Binatus sp. TaxID=2811406 RepID=UPI002719D213|nr:amidohydrolase family protein [Candidatus Binatus sp.]
MASNERERVAEARDARLAQVVEQPLEPALPIIDPHHHLWDHPDSRYLLDEILRDTNSGHRVLATVFVECFSMYRADGPEAMKPVGETEFVNGIAAQSASGRFGETRVAAGIVSFADLALGDAVTPVLEAHIAAAPARFRGIRHAAGWDASPQVQNSHTNPPADLYQSKKFREGFARLKKLNLSFDAWQYHPQIPQLTDLAKAFPDTTIILDHFGGPLAIGPYEGKRAEIFAQWKKHIADLARCPNVVVKLGGINMPVNGFGWHRQPAPPTSDELVAATRDYYLHTIEQFGPARCMFESNFPVDRISCSYGVLWNAFKKIAAPFSAGEKADLFHRTAARVYRLKV